MNLLAQLFGLMASLCTIISSQRRYKTEILLLLLLGECFFAFNFLFLGAYSGFLMSLIAAIITTISYLYSRINKRIPTILIIAIIVLLIIAGFSCYQKITDILPVISLILYVILVIQKKEKNIRRISLVSASLWIIYDISVGAYVGMISDTLYIISSFTAIIRYDSKLSIMFQKHSNIDK